MRAPATDRPLGAVFKENVTLLAVLVALLWSIEIVDRLPGLNLQQHGIQPRESSGLAGILFAPFLHAGFDHLAMNTVSLVIFGGIVLAAGRRLFALASLVVILLGGALVWLLGPAHTNHIGASGVIFGYLGFILTRGIFARSIGWVLLGVVVAMLYGGMLSGMLPTRLDVSWQSHLFGFIAGVCAAAWLARPRRRERVS